MAEQVDIATETGPVAAEPSKVSALERLTELLGEDVFLVPCIRGTKMPAVTYTQRPFEATQTPAYRYALRSGEFNIAVYLGQMSGGLYLLINLATRQVMINARAVVLAVNDADWCRDWLAYVERMIQEHKGVRARYESARNN